MTKAKEYRQFARDCIRIAESMNGKDRQTLLSIAEAWELRAQEMERQEAADKAPLINIVRAWTDITYEPHVRRDRDDGDLSTGGAASP